jgi:3',5'-cyclic AMP phosphodiesterase CpdA
MRLAHLTDLHVERVPRLQELGNKRLAGAINLYLLGRRGHFSVASQEAAVQAVLDAGVDGVLCTGDLTATATEAEFVAAAELLRPLTDRLPFVVIPGNHDRYTGESLGRFERHFGRWAGSGDPPWVARLGGVDFVGVDVARAHWLSSGEAPERELAALDALLGTPGPAVVVLVHYPLRDRRGEPYGPATRAITNAAAIEAVLVRHPRVAAVLHGHEHHGYRTEIPGGARPIPSYNPGASGYAFLPKRHRTAHFNVYDIDETGIRGVERFAFDGARFLPEAGGAYATGG